MIAHVWAAMWPNIFAPSCWTLVGLAASHAHTHRKLSHVHRRLDEFSPCNHQDES